MSGLFLYCGIVGVFHLVRFFELTFPDSQGWLSVMELASYGQRGNRSRLEMEKEYVCVCVCVCVCVREREREEKRREEEKRNKLFRSSL
jgi:hypothetical protein